MQLKQLGTKHCQNPLSDRLSLFAWMRGTKIIDLIFQEIQGKPWAACARGRGVGLVSHFLVGAFEEKIPPYVLLGLQFTIPVRVRFS